MSAVVPLRSSKAASAAELEQQLTALDVEIEDALVRLAAGEVSDDDVAALRAKRARLIDRIDGSRLLAQRAAERADREDRERRLTALAAATTRLREVDALLSALAEKVPAFVEPLNAIVAEAEAIAAGYVDDVALIDREREALGLTSAPDVEPGEMTHPAWVRSHGSKRAFEQILASFGGASAKLVREALAPDARVGARVERIERIGDAVGGGTRPR